METLHPGLYFQEVSDSPNQSPVVGYENATAGFVGVAQRGQVGVGVKVSSWVEFQKVYGEYIANSYLSYAVRGFFENGGQVAYISRVAHYASGVSTVAYASATVGGSTPFLTIRSKTEGSYGNSISVEFKNIVGNKFDATVKYKGVVQETFTKQDLVTGDDYINSISKFVYFTVTDSTKVPTAGVITLTNGNDGLTGLNSDDYLQSLHGLDGLPVDIVSIPGVTDTATQAGIQAYVDGRGDCFAILEVPMGKTPQTALDYLTTNGIISERVAVYYPWIKVPDPIGVGANPTKLVPPSGHITGIYARTDAERGIFKAPAGLGAVLRGISGVERNVSEADQDLLNPASINCIRTFTGTGSVLWGARTLSDLPDYQYVNVRRTLDFLNSSIREATRFAVFEPNDEDLWSKIQSVVTDLLRGFWKNGGLRGNSEGEAFFVQCDEGTTTPEDIMSGVVNVNIGVATQKPAEFIIFTVTLIK